MSKHLAPSQTNQLLQSLSTTVKGFAEREEELERAHLQRIFVAKRDLEEAVTAEETKLEADLASSENYFADLRARADKRHAERTGSIIRNHAVEEIGEVLRQAMGEMKAL